MASFNDMRDRRTCYLFGDGAGAMLLSKSKGFATFGPPLVESVGPAADLPLPVDPAAPLDRAYSLALYHQPREKLQEGFEHTLQSLLSRDGM